MQRTTHLLLALLLGCAVGSEGQDVRAALDAYIAAVNSGDPDAVAALYAEAPTTSTIGDGEIQTGWTSVRDVLRDLYQESGAVGLEARNVVVTPAGDDVAVVHFEAYWSYGSQVQTRIQGAMTVVFVRTRDGWKVMHDHTSTLPGSAVTVMVPSITTGDEGPPSPVRETGTCEVSHIVDGDTIECDPFGRIRLIGMDTPEGDQQPFGDLATEALRSMIGVGTEVMIEPDVEPYDQYDRLLAYVWTEDGLVNWALVRSGYAVVLTYPPNVQYVDWFEAAQIAAREEGAGLWAIDGFACPPRAHRRGQCE